MVGVLLNRDLSNRFNAVLEKEGRSKREVIEAFIRNYIEQDEKNSVKA
jgi:metal-responsive CopG/Arc/MetJ family transcriptional regulator